MIDLGQAIDFGDWKIPIVRIVDPDAEPVFVRGNLVEPETDDDFIRGKIQPMNGRDLMQLPEGIREEAKMVLGTRSTVNVNDQVTDTRDGRQYKVLHVAPSTIGGNRSRAALGLL